LSLSFPSASVSISFLLLLSLSSSIFLSMLCCCLTRPFFLSSRNFLAHWISSFTTPVSSKEEVWIPWAPWPHCSEAFAAAGFCAWG
jgi:hypothetical protein